jgi:hypothetical protein
MLRSCFHDAVTTCLLTIDVDLLHRVVPAARRGEVEVSDLPLPSNQQAEPAFEEFDKNWNEAVAAGNPKLMKVNVQRLADGLPALRWWTFGTACALLQPSKKLDLVVAAVADSFAIVSLMLHCDFIRCGRMFLGNAAPLAICLFHSVPPFSTLYVLIAGPHQDLWPRCVQGRRIQAALVCLCYHGRCASRNLTTCDARRCAVSCWHISPIDALWTLMHVHACCTICRVESL